MTNHKLLLLVFLSLVSIQVRAYDAQDGNVTAVIGPYAYKTNFNSTDTGAKSPILGDFGLLIGGDLDANQSLEIAVLHMHELFYRDKDAQSIVEESQVIHITMGYRRWLNHYFSVGAGFFSAYPMDETRIVHSDFAPGTEIQTSARDTTKYGFDFSIQTELWHDNFLSVIADARYSLATGSKNGEKADQYGMLIGIKYLVQEKFRNNEHLEETK